MKKIEKLMVIVIIMITVVNVSYGQYRAGNQGSSSTSPKLVTDVINQLEGKWLFKSIVFGKKLADGVEIIKDSNTPFGCVAKFINPSTDLLNFGTPDVSLYNNLPVFANYDLSKSTFNDFYGNLGQIAIFKNNQVDNRTRFYFSIMPIFNSDGSIKHVNLVSYIDTWKKGGPSSEIRSFDANYLEKPIEVKAIPTIKQNEAITSSRLPQITKEQIDKIFPPAPLTIQQIKEALKSQMANNQKGDLKVAVYQPKTINLNITPINLSQAASYTIDNIQFETLTVDSETGIYSSKQEEWCKDIAEYTGLLNLKVLRAKTGGLQANLGVIFDHAQRKNALFLKLKEIVNCRLTISKTFTIPQADFQTATLRFEGRLTDIDAPFLDEESGNDLSGKARKPNDVNLQLSSQFTDVLLKDLKVGYNFIDINRNGKSFRIHFIINPNKS